MDILFQVLGFFACVGPLLAIAGYLMWASRRPKCPHCQRAVSADDAVCAHCGESLSPPPQPEKKTGQAARK